METISFGESRIHSLTFFDAASEEDDLGGGRIYAVLVKRALLKRMGKADESVEKLIQGGSREVSLLDGSSGAIIADTKDKTNIPIQIVCPLGFDSRLASEIYNRTGTSMSNCTIGNFLDCFEAVCDQFDVPAWTTFITWFNGYTKYFNNSIDEASLRVRVYDGQIYDGIVNPFPSLEDMSDLIAWMKSCMMLTVLLRPTSDIMADNNSEKLGFTITLSNMHGSYESYLGVTSATLHFIIRL